MKPLLVAALLVLSPIVSEAQTGVWGLRGISHDFVAVDGFVFSADGRGTAAYDARGTEIKRVDVETSEFETTELVFAAGELFVASRGGILRYRVNTAGALTAGTTLQAAEGFTHVAADSQWIAAARGPYLQVWRRDGSLVAGNEHPQYLGAEIDALAFAGGRLYAAVRTVGLHVFDPTLRERLTIVPVAARDLAVSGTTLWMAGERNGVGALDVRNPSDPVIHGFSPADGESIDRIAVAGSRVYGRRSPDLVAIFDGSSPQAAQFIGTLKEPVTALAATDTQLFIAGSKIDAWGMANETGLPLRAFDAATLKLRAEYADLAGPVSGVATDGSIAYVVDPPFFRVLDVSSTAQPHEVAAIRVERIQDSVRVKNGLAIVYGRGLVNLIDVSDPRRPRHVGTYDSTGRPPSAAAIARDTIIEGNYASGMHVVDYSDPARPYQISGRIWHYYDLTASDDVIYAIATDSTLVVADITTRNRLVTVSAGYHDGQQIDISPPGSPRPEFLVSRTTRGFEIFSLADPLHPALLGMVPVTRPGIMGTGQSSIVYEHGTTLWTIDLNSRTEPVDTGRRVLSPMQISVASTKVVVADRYGVRIFGPDTPHPFPPSRPRRRSVRP